jgi:hypothetical protein
MILIGDDALLKMGPDIQDVESRERKNPSTTYKILPVTLIGKSYESSLPKEGSDSERKKERGRVNLGGNA